MIKYSKRANITLFFLCFLLGIPFIILHYFMVGFSFHIAGILGILSVLSGVYLLLKNKGKLLFDKLLINKDSVVVDGQKIPASAIREIVAEEKGWKITIRTWVDKDVEIYLGEYLVFTDKEKLERIYKQLVALTKKKQRVIKKPKRNKKGLNLSS